MSVKVRSYPFGNISFVPGRIAEGNRVGVDGLIRAADVKTAKGIVTRPIQRLHDLEMTDSAHGNELTTKPPALREDPTMGPESDTYDMVKSSVDEDASVVKQ